MINQCDGCRRGLRRDKTYIHREKDGRPYMVCTEFMYSRNIFHCAARGCDGCSICQPEGEDDETI